MILKQLVTGLPGMRECIFAVPGFLQADAGTLKLRKRTQVRVGGTRQDRVGGIRPLEILSAMEECRYAKNGFSPHVLRGWDFARRNGVERGQCCALLVILQAQVSEA